MRFGPMDWFVLHKASAHSLPESSCLIGHFRYRNDPKFSDRYAWANSADLDQTEPRGEIWSGSTLFAILSASFGLITLL